MSGYTIIGLMAALTFGVVCFMLGALIF